MSAAALALPPYSRERPLRVVLDTNVVMALWHFRDPKLLALCTWLCDASVVLLTREECVAELVRVLAYPQFGLTAEAQTAVVTAYQALTQCVAAPTEAQALAAASLPRCKDRDDQKFLVLAWDANADLLLTRDKLLLALNRRPIYRERLAIVTPERLFKDLNLAAAELCHTVSQI